MMNDRKMFLEESIKYLNIFLKLMSHYEISLKKVDEILEEYN